MEKKQLGNSGLSITPVGLGTWAQGGGNWSKGWGDQEDADSIAAIKTAVSLGINWVDTAAIYGVGHAEEVLGRALSDIPASERPLVFTKCGRHYRPDGSITGILKRESVIAEAEASLKRLGIETIDLYQIHWPLPDEDIEEAWETLQELKKSGKVRHTGVSNFNAAQLKRIEPIAEVTSLQPPYSMVVREVEKETLPSCREKNIGVIAYSPMQKGLLTGKYTLEKVRSFPENDHRREDPLFSSPKVEKILALVDECKVFAAERGHTAAQLAVAWVINQHGLTGAIVGARSPEQIRETVQAGKWNLSEEELARLREMIERRL